MCRVSQIKPVYFYLHFFIRQLFILCFSPGLSDSVITSDVVHALQAYYSYFMDASHIQTSYDVNAEHCLPTLNYGEDCLVLNSPYLGNCKYDGAGVGLKAIYGALNERVAVADPSRLFEFSQLPYFTDKHSSIGDVGYIYVPTACENGLVRNLSILMCI